MRHLILAALALAGSVAPVPAPPAAPAHPCATATGRCDGTVEVPLDWEGSVPERITVGFAWLPRRDTSTAAHGTILIHPGGFGAYTAGLPVFEELLGPVLDHQNLLVVDMRGTGTSSPVRCDALDVRVPATIPACAEHLGPRARFFATDQAVRDMDAVRAALGVPRVTFHGSSYGTVFAQAYAARFPGRTAAVFLDSPDPIGPDGFATNLRVDNFGAGLRDLDAVCEHSRPCRDRAGSADGRLTALVSALRAAPDPEVPPSALAQLVHKKAADPTIGRELNAAVAAHLDGDPAPLRRLAAPILPTLLEPGVPINPQDSAGMAYSCTDVRYPFDPGADAETRQRQLDADYARRAPVRPFTVDEVFGFIGGSYPAWCVHWPAPRIAPPVPPGARYPDVPAMVVGGELGAGMGADAARAVAARFPRGQVVTVPFGGHVDALGGTAAHQRCLREAMRRFLTDPARPVPDPGCTARNWTAMGSFPRSVDAVRGGPVAAAFLTVEDALGRCSRLTGRETDLPGLRGGRIRVDRATCTVHLDGTRFVDDLTVTGTARAGEGDRATADVAAELGGRTVHLRLDWSRPSAADPVPVTVTADGRSYTIAVPVP